MTNNSNELIATTAATSNVKKVAVGISSCLMGQTVRYNGGHTRSRLCHHNFAQHFSFESFCPEVAAGFGTPRPTMRLIGDPNNPTLTFSDDEQQDLTEQLKAGFKEKLEQMSHLHGFILMKNSPSCGMSRVKVYQKNGYPHEQRSMGLFAQALQERYPLMPIEEEGRLHDSHLFENFVIRVYAHQNFHQEVLAELSMHKLYQFHSSYKYVLMSHNQNKCKELGRLLSQKTDNIELLANDYLSLFMQTLSKPASKKNHTNTLYHIAGYLKNNITASARQHIAEVIKNYHDGELPLNTPLTLLKHYFVQNEVSYIDQQRYLNPYPKEIAHRYFHY